MHMKCCDMKGFLSYLIIWNLSKKNMNGVELAKELEKKKGLKTKSGNNISGTKRTQRKRIDNSRQKQGLFPDKKRGKRTSGCLWIFH